MTILYVCNHMAELAGMQVVISGKINWLAEHGHKIVLFLADQGEHLAVKFHESVIIERPGIFFYRTYQQPIWKRPLDNHKRYRLFRQKLDESIERNQPDVVVVTSLYMIRDVCKVCKTTPVIAEMHNNEGSRFRKSNNETKIGDWIREYHRHGAKRLSRMVVLTEGDKRDWMRYMPEDNIKVIPNIARQNDTGRQSTTENKHVIFTGRITFQKGIDYLIKSWAIVNKSHPDWVLDVYGKAGVGDDLRYQQLLDSCKEKLNIALHNPTPEIMERMVESSIFVLTSRYEAFGLVIAEAMSCGLPVVAFDCPYGPRDIITDGEDGFLVPLGDCEALAEKIIYLIEHPEERKRMGRNGAETSKRFTSEMIMPQWEKLFEEVNKNKRQEL